jgi:hypothetical protein
MRIRRSRWFVMRAAIATFAIVVQALIPVVVAAEIAAAAGAPPICSVPAGGDHRGDHHSPSGTCSICTALAAASAVTAPAPPAVPLPRLTATSLPAAVTIDAAEIALPTFYRSRAPPLA